MNSCYVRKIFLWAMSATLLFCSGVVDAQTYKWVKHSEGSSAAATTAAGDAVVTDKQGNVYAAGTFRGPAKFGTQILPNAGETDVFLVKYNASGDFQWVASGGGLDLDSATAIGLDASNNIYVLGVFRQNATFGSKTETSQGGSDAFLVKYNSQGVMQWFVRMGGAGDDRASGMSIDGKGNIYITGTFEGPADFLGQTMTSVGTADMFTLKMDLDHVLKWYKQAGDFGARTAGLDIRHDGSGSSFVTGYFTTTLTYGSAGQMIDAGLGDFFVAKYDADGGEVWAKRGGGLGFDVGTSISTDQLGNVYVSGTIDSAATFGTTALDFHGHIDGFVARYSGAGDLQWIKTIGGMGYDNTLALRSDQAGNSYVVGEFSHTVDFGGTTLTSNGNPDSTDIYISKYSPSGELIWVFNTGGSWNDGARSVWIDRASNKLFVSGYYSDEIYFGPELPENKISGGYSEFFVGEVNQPLTITLGAIPNGPFCPGSQINIPFTTSGEFNSSNTFGAVLSDENGNFDVPTIIGTLATTTGGTIQATIPASTPNADKYRIRILASDPFTTSADNGSDISINSNPTVTVGVSGSTTICAGDSVELSGPAGFATYIWSNGASTQNIWVKEAGSFSVTAANGTGCTGTSEAVTIGTYPTPAKPTITREGDNLVADGGVSFSWLDAGDNVVSSSKTFTPSASGAYRVQSVDANGCKATSDPYEYSTTGVPTDLESEGIAVYPQPTTGVIRVEMGAVRSGAVRLTLTNTIGETVLVRNDRTDGGEYRTTLDVAKIPAGVYNLEVVAGGKKWNRRVVKQ